MLGKIPTHKDTMAASDDNYLEEGNLQMDGSCHHAKHSNSADLPSTPNHHCGDLTSCHDIDQIQTSESNMFRSRFNGLHTKEAEQEHYTFLNEMRVRLGVDSQRLIDLEARITCKYGCPVLNRKLKPGLIILVI